MTTEILLGLMMASAGAALFWPKGGLWYRWNASRRNVGRVEVEDALKHLYNCEYNRIVCTLENLAGALFVSTDRVAGVIERLSSMRLIVHHGSALKLTEEGREYALRVIRVHRLWERYLADETAVRELEWHSDAEKKEHLLTQREAEALAIRLGHPPYDPHGDPIPTVSGILPAQQGKPLHSFKAGDVVRITHMEDEPAAIYAQVLANKLFPGVSVKILDRSSAEMLIEVEGKNIALPTTVAGNVHAAFVDKKEAVLGPRRSLASLGMGDRGTVARISHACRGMQRRRLMDLGIVPGTVVEAEMKSASGDPTAYNIRGASIALRKQLAEMIFIE